MSNYDGISTFDELLTKEYGEIGSESRNEYEINARYFIISEMMKDARQEAKMSIEDLAVKAGVSKSAITKIENGNTDVRLSTLFRIFENGLNRRVNLTFS